MSEGDSVFVGPFVIEQFRDTHNPGPQDSGDTVILSRGTHGVLSADTNLLIPDVPNLPAIARFLAEHPETVDALGIVVQSASFFEAGFPSSLPERRDAPEIVSGLLKAMRGEVGHE